MKWSNDRRRLGDLIPWSRNPRRISAESASRLISSLEDIGQPDVISIGPDNEVYNGHQRLTVWSQAFGPDYEVAVRISDRPLTEEEKERLLVDLHEGAVGEWDFSKLSDNFDFDRLIDLGFPEDLLPLEMGNGSPPADEDLDDIIPLREELREKWGTEPGQMWRLGESLLLCGDCTSAKDLALFDMIDIGAIITDPPYGIEREGITNDNPEGLEDLYKKAVSLFPASDAVLIAFQSPRLFPTWLDVTRKYGWIFERALWFYDATDVTYPWRGWLMTSQIALVSSIGKPEWAEGVYHHDCYIVETAGDQDDSGGHTAAKPLDIVIDLVKHTTGAVYDPFSGSGTTLIGCNYLKRECRAVEIDPAYVAVTLERYYNITGDTPEVISGGS